MVQTKIKIAVTPLSPFVIERRGQFTGFEIELWEAIARRINQPFVYELHRFTDLLPLIEKKKVDVALAAITVTEKREKLVDFSHPTFDSGLRIMLAKNRSQLDLLGTIELFFRQGYQSLFKPFLVLIVTLLLIGNLLWLAEEGSGAFALDYLTGLSQATWLSLSVALGSPSMIMLYEPKTWLGILLIQLTQLLKLAILGVVIGEIAAFFTTRKIRLNIQGPRDLAGRRVATVSHSTSEQTLPELDAVIVPVAQIEQAYDLLKTGEVEVVVFDEPTLLYYQQHGGAWTELVGKTFAPQEYALALPSHSRLREKINRALLALRESGRYDEIYKKWFGN